MVIYNSWNSYSNRLLGNILGRRNIIKKLISILTTIFVLAFSIQAFAATNEEKVKGSAEGYLISDTGESLFVEGRRVNTPITLLSDENTVTYEFILYGNPEYILSGNQTDGSESIRVYLNLHYKTQPNGQNSEYLLIKVTGNWDILDSRVSVSSASLTYGCSDTGHSQSGTKAVNNNFSVNTGFSGYVLPEMGGICGATLTTNLKMGSTRTWSFVMKNNIFG